MPSSRARSRRRSTTCQLPRLSSGSAISDSAGRTSCAMYARMRSSSSSSSGGAVKSITGAPPGGCGTWQPRAAVATGAGLHDARGVAADRLLVDLLDEPVLGAEVVVQRALGDADVGRHDVEARARAMLGEPLDRGVEEGAPSAFAEFDTDRHTYPKVS